MVTERAYAQSAAQVSVPIDAPARLSSSAMRVERAGVMLGLAGALIGVAVLFGYVVRSEAIVKLSPGLPPMYPNTAVGLAAGGLAIVGVNRSGRWRVVAAIGALTIMTIGVVELVLNVAEAGPTWFEGLFPDDFVAATTPVGGRPVSETCLAFIFLGGAIGSLLVRRWSVLGQALGVAGSAVGVSATVGYALGVDRSTLGGTLVYVGMALHTGLAIALLGAAAVLVRPQVGFLAQLLGGGATGGVIRRVTLAVGSVPVVLVVLGVLLDWALPTEALSQSVFSVVQVGVLGAAVLVPAGIIASTERQLREQLDQARRRDEHRRDVDSLADAITDEMVVTVPEVPGWDVAMRYRPATGHIAGDSVQVHHRTDPSSATLLAVVDIAGHDAYSALVAYGLRTHVAAMWEGGADLATLAASANSKLVRRDTIASGVLMSFDHATGAVHLVNAGHPPPLHVRGGHAATWERTGPLFGLDVGRQQVRTLDLHRDDLVVIWTDGLIEARSPAGEQLGETRLARLITSRHEDEPQAIADACIDMALQHSGARLRDDAVVVVARRLH